MCFVLFVYEMTNKHNISGKLGNVLDMGTNSKHFLCDSYKLKMAFVKQLNVWKYVSNATFNGVYEGEKSLKLKR